ncbi:MAG TPA: diguanylate cyclase [Myxococcales bacterium]|nr:diguanylate cyclase [Myxococcales bacterium]
MPTSVLLVSPDGAERERLRMHLESRGVEVVLAADSEQALDAARGRAFSAVVAGLALLPFDGLTLYSRLRDRRPEQELVLLVDRPETRVRALEAGLTDCVVRPVEEGELDLAIQRCVERSQLRAEQVRLSEENLAFARHHSVYERCLQLLSNIDLEWLQERLVQDLSSSSDAQSAALWVVDDRGELRLRSYRGLVDKHALGERLAVTPELSAQIQSGVPWVLGEGRQQVLYVPLAAQGEPVGYAQLWDPLAGAFSPEQRESARLLADFASVGLRNGRKFLALQRLGLRDPDTAAYNLSYFTDYAGKEIYKARRYGRTFSLLIFSLDQLQPIRLRLGVEDARKATRGVIRALAGIIRDSDVIAKASENELYLLLPETDFFGASMFLRRAAAAVREEPDAREVEAKMSIGLVCGASTFPRDGEDFDELVHRCRTRAEERRASLQRTLQMEALSFWEQVEVLLGTPSSPPLPVDERAAPSRRGKVSEGLFQELQMEIARELLRDPLSRGLVYVGGPEVRADLPIARGLEGAPAELGSRVYALGRRTDLDSHPTVTPVFLEGDERLAKHEFLLWLSESSAYALVQRPGRGATWGFHTSDTAVVDHLIGKLQSEYDLQPY